MLRINRLVLWILLLAVFSAAPVMAQYCHTDAIGFYTDPYGDLCELEIMPYVPYTIYIVVNISGHLDPISHLEFQIDDMLDPAQSEGMVTLTWGDYSVQGDPETGVIITFDPPLEMGDGRVVLGSMDIISFDANWPATDHIMSINYYSAHIWDVLDQTFCPSHGMFHFNSTDPYNDCYMAGDWNETYKQLGGFSPATDTIVHGGCNLEFSAFLWECIGGTPGSFTGEVLLNGDLIHQFNGEGTETYNLPIDVTGLPQGSIAEVEVSFTGWSNHALLHYEVDNFVPTIDTSFSAIKGLY